MRADRNAAEIAVDLNPTERTALDPLSALSGKFLGPTARREMESYSTSNGDEWQAQAAATGQYWATRLGYPDDKTLEQEVNRLTDAIHAGRPMTFRDWKAAIDIVSNVMSPRDSEWQTNTGIDYLQTATALVAVTRKVDLAFGGTILNPAPRN